MLAELLFVFLPRPARGETSAGRVSAVAGALLPSYCAAVDGCCFSSPGARAVSPVLVLIHDGVAVRRPLPTDSRTTTECIVLVATDPSPADPRSTSVAVAPLAHGFVSLTPCSSKQSPCFHVPLAANSPLGASCCHGCADPRLLGPSRRLVQ